MKTCPACKRVETDDALTFCRADGTALISDSGSVSAEIGTAKFSSAPVVSEIETSILPQTVTDADMSRPTAPTTVLDRQTTIGKTHGLSKTKWRKATGLILVATVIAAIAGLAYYYYPHENSAAINSIAVLPFQNSSGDPNVDYLSDGVTESIINSLSRLTQLKVMARSTMFRFKGRESDPQAVGKELGVNAVMTGRMLQQGDNLALSVELVNVADGTQLWGEQYNRRAADLATVQQEIARDISERLRLRFSGEDRQLNKGGTNNTEAYQSYLRGRYYWNKRTSDGFKKAIEQFQQAIDRDPNYALAYDGLADCYLLLEQYASTPASETLPKAKAAAERALQIDDSLAEAHASLACYYDQSWRWDEAEEEFKRAISLNPNYPTAHHWYEIHLRLVGRLDEALAEIKRAQELDPLSPTLYVNVSFVYFLKNDLGSALEQARRGVDLDPNYPIAHQIIGRVYIKQRRYPEAVAEFQQDVAAERTAHALKDLGNAYAVAGKRDEALAVLKELEEKYQKHESLGQYVALVYAGLGDLGQTFAWLEKDFQAHSGELSSVIEEPGFDSIRGDPRYTDLLRRMGMRPWKT
jgi:TolB-like protein/Tfp pilus assembly protein PilF